MFEIMPQNIENIAKTDEIAGSPIFFRVEGRVKTYIENRFVKKCFRQWRKTSKTLRKLRKLVGHQLFSESRGD